MTRLHIDLANGALEVEGEEEFVKSIYSDFKDQLTVKNLTSPKPIVDDSKSSGTPSTKKPKHVSKSASSTERYTLIKEIDFTKGEGDVTLKDFYKQKSPTSFAEKNVVFVYFLRNKLKVLNVTLNHIYTCYEEVGSRKPDAFKQSVADTSSKKGWLNTSSFDDITVPIRGQNFVDHDLPAKKIEKE